MVGSLPAQDHSPCLLADLLGGMVGLALGGQDHMAPYHTLEKVGTPAPGSMDLTEAKALELNKALSGALDRQDWAITRDLLQQLQTADASNKLKAASSAPCRLLPALHEAAHALSGAWHNQAEQDGLQAEQGERHRDG